MVARNRELGIFDHAAVRAAHPHIQDALQANYSSSFARKLSPMLRGLASPDVFPLVRLPIAFDPGHAQRDAIGAGLLARGCNAEARAVAIGHILMPVVGPSDRPDVTPLGFGSPRRKIKVDSRNHLAARISR